MICMNDAVTQEYFSRPSRLQIAFSVVLKGEFVVQNTFLGHFFKYPCFAGKLKWERCKDLGEFHSRDYQTSCSWFQWTCYGSVVLPVKEEFSVCRNYSFWTFSVSITNLHGIKNWIESVKPISLYQLKQLFTFCRHVRSRLPGFYLAVGKLADIPFRLP